MFENVKGKKILIVGSTFEEETVKAAHEMGLHVTVVDNILDRNVARAKVIADDAWDISYFDTDVIAKKCRENHIIGVFAGYGETRVIAAIRIANALGTPFYATEDQIELTADKNRFKAMCLQYGIPVPRTYGNGKWVSDTEEVSYPVIVKPADRSGRIGVNVCHNYEELINAMNTAIGLSPSETIVVEDYLEGVELSAVYTLKNNEASLSCLNEKYITEDQLYPNLLCDCAFAPARFIDQFIEEVDAPIKRFLNGIGLRNGMANFQGMYTEKGIYIFEMGLRINGNNDWKVIDWENGISFLKMMMSYSLTGDMGDDLKKDQPKFNTYYCTLPFYAHAGTVTEISIGNALAYDWCQISTQNVSIGAKMIDDGTGRQKTISFLIKAGNLLELADRITTLQNEIVVKDENGNNMLFDRFRAEKLLV